MKSNFQRGQSKVWWGNYNRPCYENEYDYSSIEREICLRMQQKPEAETPKTPEKKLSTGWINRQGSPSSHKSQDSGFSDTENSPPNAIDIDSQTKDDSNHKNFTNCTNSPERLTPKKCINECTYQRSPSTSSEIATPPTVIRRIPFETRINTEDIKCRRISYSAPTSPVSAQRSLISPNIDDTSIISKIDDLSFDSTSPLGSMCSISNREENENADNERRNDTLTSSGSKKTSSLKRNRVITKNSKFDRSLLGCLSQNDSKSTNDVSCLNSNISLFSPKTPKGILKSPMEYQNETVYFGACNQNQSGSNEPVKEKILPTYAELYPNSTSTPIMYHSSQFRSDPVTPTRSNIKRRPHKLIDNLEFADPESSDKEKVINRYSNGDTPATQNWLLDLRHIYAAEVMSVLQTKSIEVNNSNGKLPSVTVVKLIKNLQTKLADLQLDSDNVENIFGIYQANFSNLENPNNEIIKIISSLIQNLVDNVYEFIFKLSNLKCVVLKNNSSDMKRLEENMHNIIELTNDLKISSENIYNTDMNRVKEDFLLLKRYLLIIIRTVFDKLVNIIVLNIEDNNHELILRANLSYISILSNCDLKGLASLNDALMTNGIVRVLLIICLENRSSSIRAQALRALATVCSTTDTITQLHNFDGIEVLRYILCDDLDERTSSETREAISVLTQITAPWHTDNYNSTKCETAERGVRLADCIGVISESILNVVDRTECAQTLLLCTACLNNFSRLESIAIYTFIANEAILKFKAAIDRCNQSGSIFLYEQITSMIFNMSMNKKSHYHLSTKSVVQFLTSFFQSNFQHSYPNKAENDSLKKTIKSIIHIFACLINESSVGKEILENNIVPIFSQIEINGSTASDFVRDITFLNRKINESISVKSPTTLELSINSNGKKPQENTDLETNTISKRVVLSRQESYV